MNKNIIKIFAALTLASAALVGCSNAPKEPVRTGDVPSVIESQPENVHYVITEATPKRPNSAIKGEDGTLFKSITIENVQITQKSRVDKPNADKMELVLSRAKDRLLDAYDAEIDYFYEELEAGTLDEASLPHETKADYTILRNDGRAISIMEQIDALSAGNVTNTSRFCYNFDPVTGAHITTSLFYTNGDGDSLDAADEVMYKKLVEKYGEEVISYDNITVSFVDSAQDTWYFTEDGVHVFFNAGDIAGEEHGVLEVDYSKDELPEFSQKYFG